MITQLADHIIDVVAGKIPFGSKRSDKWAETRKAHLLKEPFCQCCGTEEHLQVHHKEPFHLKPELELDLNNLITLCEKPGRFCHIIFGHLRSFKSYNPNVVEDVKNFSEKVKNRP